MQVLEFNQKELDESKVIIDGRIDPAFRKINKNTIGFHIWRVDCDRIEALPKSQYGKFYDDNAYIIYAASVKGTYANHESISRDLKPPTPAIERYLHFWLGGNTSTEKSGAVAYKVIELDVHIGYTTTQYREVQGNESPRFLSYFKQDGITILCGSTNTSITSSDIQLFQIRGKKSPMCVQKSSIEWSHFSSRHVMIYQTEIYLFVWIGRSSSLSERLHGLKMAIRLRDVDVTSKKRQIVIVDDGYEQSINDDKKFEWNRHLSLSQRFVQPHLNSVNGQNGDHALSCLKLYKCGHSNGKYRIEEIKTSLLEQNDLIDPESAYIIDGGEKGVWIWIGRGINTQEKAEAMRNARGFVKKKKYSSATPVVRVVHNYEPEEFIRLFPTWNTNDIICNGNKTSTVIGKFDSLTLMQRPKLAAQTQLIDDGSGAINVFRVDGNKLIELPKITFGSLFSGDVYIVTYTATFPDNIKELTTKLHHIIYLWTGKNATPNEKMNGENLIAEISDRLGKSTLQIRLAEGYESPHFLQIFKGSLVIFNGKGIDYDPNGLNMREPNSYVLKINGNSTFTSKAVQVTPKTIYTSNDCFVLKTNGHDIWVWCGQGSTGDTREIAKSIGGSLGEYTLVIESNEPDEFWAVLNDKIAINLKRARTNTVVQNAKGVENLKPALFVGQLESGNIVLSQIIGFEQKDLCPEDVYLLDTGTQVFIWLGCMSSPSEKSMSWAMAHQLIAAHPTPRENKIPVTLIKQGYEPPTFMGFFDSWNPKVWSEHQSFELVRRQIEPTFEANRHVVHQNEVNDDFDQHQKYPIELLRSEVEGLPDEIDPKRKEIHLTHDDFVSVFNMSFSEFEKLPSWRKQELKKKNKLF